MAVRCTEKFPWLGLFLFLSLSALFVETTSSSTSDKAGLGGLEHFSTFRSVTEPAAPPPGVRLHPGVVASVVIVAVAAIVAAGFIIRKYCFLQSDATYRYSVLRRMEEQRVEESDEELLE